ncbi:MAG: hypothetical protein H0T79_00520 [Deltaproteobacteria bacterium]|nr:hypothetical protein [Deltaproteobacteria bacterium]
MTKLVRCCMFILAGAGCKPAMFNESKGDIAKVAAKQYALEAYPQWAVSHPATECPATLDELSQFINRKDSTDPWGTPFTMLCGPTRPASAKGMVVRSAGPDKQAGTADDLTSE